MKKQSPLKPHELAHHVAVLFRSSGLSDMEPVKFSMAQGIRVLQAAKPTLLDLTDPDKGIAFAMQVERENCPEKAKAAARLLILCLHAIECGETTASQRQHIPLHLAALAGYVPDQNSASAKHKRPNRGEDALDRGIKEALIAKPSANWQERAYWLRNEGVVTEFNSEILKFTDGKEESEPITISIRTFQNRITKVKNKAQK